MKFIVNYIIWLVLTAVGGYISMLLPMPEYMGAIWQVMASGFIIGAIVGVLGGGPASGTASLFTWLLIWFVAPSGGPSALVLRAMGVNFFGIPIALIAVLAVQNKTLRK